MPMAAWAAAEWAGWICKRDGRPQRVQATLNKPSLCRELELEACFVTPSSAISAPGLEPSRARGFCWGPVQSGVDLNTVRELLGHSDITMVLRYAHLSPDRLVTAVEKVARSCGRARSC
jgi:hypothetical protein